MPVIGDIGMVWPVMASKLADAMGVKLEFMSYKQETPDGKAMREWIVDNIKMFDRDKMLQRVAAWRS